MVASFPSSNYESSVIQFIFLPLSHSVDHYAVGLDVHEMLTITKGSNSSMSRVRGDGQAASTYSLPKEIYVVKDDEKDTVSHVPSEEHLTKRKSKREISSM